MALGRLAFLLTTAFVLIAEHAYADDTITVKSGAQNGEVVDGAARIPMQNGVARVELAPGDRRRIPARIFIESKRRKDPALRALYPSTQTPDSLCSGSSHAASLDEVCRLNSESKKHSIISILTAANGIFLVTAGLLVWFTGGTIEKPRVAPMIAPGTAGLATFGAF